MCRRPCGKSRVREGIDNESSSHSTSCQTHRPHHAHLSIGLEGIRLSLDPSGLGNGLDRCTPSAVASTSLDPHHVARCPMSQRMWDSARTTCLNSSNQHSSPGAINRLRRTLEEETRLETTSPTGKEAPQCTTTQNLTEASILDLPRRASQLPWPKGHAKSIFTEAVDRLDKSNKKQKKHG